MKISLKNVRLSFPALFHKAVFDGNETKYEATLLINKDTQSDQIDLIAKRTKELIKDNLKGTKLGSDKLCMKDGDEYEYTGYADHMSFKASNSKRPLVIDRDKSPLTEDDNRIYAGCYVNAVVELWAQNNAYGKRINAILLGIQFFKDGEPFADGETGSADDFEAFEEDDDDFFG